MNDQEEYGFVLAEQSHGMPVVFTPAEEMHCLAVFGERDKAEAFVASPDWRVPVIICSFTAAEMADFLEVCITHEIADYIVFDPPPRVPSTAWEMAGCVYPLEGVPEYLQAELEKASQPEWRALAGPLLWVGELFETRRSILRLAELGVSAAPGRLVACPTGGAWPSCCLWRPDSLLLSGGSELWEPPALPL